VNSAGPGDGAPVQQEPFLRGRCMKVFGNCRVRGVATVLRIVWAACLVIWSAPTEVVHQLG